MKFTGWKECDKPGEPIKTRHIDGTDASLGGTGDLYLNYGFPDKSVYFGNIGMGITNNGSYYTGTAARANIMPDPANHPNTMFKNMGRSLTTDITNNPNYEYAYIGSISNGVTIGLPTNGNPWYHILNFRHGDNNGYNAQIALTLVPHGNPQNIPRLFFRSSGGTVWTPWYEVNATKI